ncbi:MAG: decaprenyl-phosphate phosphoribosyltransferase [Deltaproteobacteria bacterium]|nr:decaprenyl-phosphate phosphoribosyltransferase [Deltaproteobacteria bacterium]MBW2362346.1 decaprenyl-phosphate phosphoribosyltransferase [Deltaproteobacteria bacterium]
MLQLLRAKQWTKNLLLFAALVFAQRLFDPHSFLTACIAFGAFCLASSSGYVVNDLVDVERDRQHPYKRNRPIASGRVAPAAAAGLAALLTAGALAVAWGIGWPFTVATVAYLALTHFYTFVGKNLVVLDILLVAFGFVLRAVAGALAIGVPFSDWFVLCTFFVAIFIAVAKRRSELNAAAADFSARPVLGHYTRDALTAFGTTAMAASVISYSLWVQDELEQAGGEPRTLLFTVPFVILAIFRYHLLVERGEAGERPEDTLLTDRPLQVAILGFALVAVAAFYLAP